MQAAGRNGLCSQCPGCPSRGRPAPRTERSLPGGADGAPLSGARPWGLSLGTLAPRADGVSTMGANSLPNLVGGGRGEVNPSRK